MNDINDTATDTIVLEDDGTTLPEAVEEAEQAVTSEDSETE